MRFFLLLILFFPFLIRAESQTVFATIPSYTWTFEYQGDGTGFVGDSGATSDIKLQPLCSCVAHEFSPGLDFDRTFTATYDGRECSVMVRVMTYDNAIWYYYARSTGSTAFKGVYTVKTDPIIIYHKSCPHLSSCIMATCTDCNQQYCATHKQHSCSDTPEGCPNLPECELVQTHCGEKVCTLEHGDDKYCKTHSAPSHVHNTGKIPYYGCPETALCDKKHCSKCNKDYCTKHYPSTDPNDNGEGGVPPDDPTGGVGDDDLQSWSDFYDELKRRLYPDFSILNVTERRQFVNVVNFGTEENIFTAEITDIGAIDEGKYLWLQDLVRNISKIIISILTLSAIIKALRGW